MKTITSNYNKPQQEQTFADLAQSISLISGKDSRFATLKDINEFDRVFLDIEGLGVREFSLKTVLAGFRCLKSVKEVIEAQLSRAVHLEYGIGTSITPATDEAVYNQLEAMHRLNRKRFNFSYEETYKAMRAFYPTPELEEA